MGRRSSPTPLGGMQRCTRFYHGIRASLNAGALIEPAGAAPGGPAAARTACVQFTAILDDAIWDAELAAGEGPGRV